MKGYLQTGQRTCHDTDGREVACEGSGHDAEFRRGIPWPTPRFEAQSVTVIDRLTGLVWLRNANIAEFPVTWQEAFDRVRALNREQYSGFSDWRLPNRRELRSLMSHEERKPALPAGHPFTNVFSGWYWTSTTASINPAFAWYVHTEGARMFYGSKARYFLVWPVRGEGLRILPATGQLDCFDSAGNRVPCEGTGQDGELQTGCAWPEPRFAPGNGEVLDRLTGLRWLMRADISGKPLTWSEAFSLVRALGQGWRVPNINELESLVDCSAHSPALPEAHPFTDVREGYWSSTTSMFEPDWAWALYLVKGAIGVGQKKGASFYVWPVRD